MQAILWYCFPSSSQPELLTSSESLGILTAFDLAAWSITHSSSRTSSCGFGNLQWAKIEGSFVFEYISVVMCTLSVFTIDWIKAFLLSGTVITQYGSEQSSLSEFITIGILPAFFRDMTVVGLSKGLTCNSIATSLPSPYPLCYDNCLQVSIYRWRIGRVKIISTGCFSYRKVSLREWRIYWDACLVK